MAIRTKFGRLKGNLESLQLPVTVWDTTGATLEADDAFNAVVAVAPDSLFDSLYPTGAPNIEECSRSTYKFEINYEVPEDTQPTAPETSSMTRRANCQTKSKTLFNFIEPIGVYDSEGESTEHYPHMKWKIDLQKAGDTSYLRSNGTSFDALPETRTLDYYLPNASVTDTYLDTVEELVSLGCFNADTFFSKPAGSVQIVRFSCSERTANDWELSFGFGYKAPQTDVEVGGDVVIPNMLGSYYSWTLDNAIFNDTEKIFELKTKAAIVGRVWDHGDFTVLGLPGA